MAAAALLGATVSTAAWTQDAESEAAQAPEVAVKTMPAEIMQLTPQSLLLGVVTTGDHLIAVGGRGAIIASQNGNDWVQVEVTGRPAPTTGAYADHQNGWERKKRRNEGG